MSYLDVLNERHSPKTPKTVPEAILRIEGFLETLCSTHSLTQINELYAKNKAFPDGLGVYLDFVTAYHQYLQLKK